MKLRKAIGGLLFGAGCALTFIGLLALILPSIENDQLKLVLASFDAPSDHMLVRWMNSGMSFALHHGWQVLIGGAILLIAGLLLLVLFFRDDQPVPQDDPYRRPDPQHEPLWESPAAQPEYQPNPFADMALWDHHFAPSKTQQPEHSFASFASFGGPMLEPNRIENAPVCSFAEDAYAQPAAEHAEKASTPFPDHPICEAPPAPRDFFPPIPEAAPAPVQPISFSPLSSPHAVPVPKPEPAPAPERPIIFSPPSLDTPPVAKPEPVYTPNEEPDEPAQISSRIRSTIGLHRQR